MKVTLNNLFEHLVKTGLHPQLQRETNQIYMILELSEKKFPLFFRIFDQGYLLQLLAFIPTTIKAGAHANLARLLHQINKEVDIPGFGMDEDNDTVFFRCMLPIHKEKIEFEIIDSYIKVCTVVCKSTGDAVIAAANGLETFEEICQKRKTKQPIKL